MHCRAIRKQVRRNRNLFDVADEELPVVATIASQFADGGVDAIVAESLTTCRI